MKLSELKPRWTSFDGSARSGISFECPHCRTTRLAVVFCVPTGTIFAGPVWSSTGVTFDNLTLSPSLDFSGEGHWHGHVTNGAIAP